MKYFKYIMFCFIGLITFSNNVFAKEGYISCDVAPDGLNLRDKVNGNQVSYLTCGNTLEVLDENAGTTSGVCDKWYKVTYTKHDNNYTGYVCSTYIKKVNTNDSTYNRVYAVINKANDYYDKTRLMPYCGKTTIEKKVKFKEGNGSFEGEYYQSEFKNLD